MHFDLSTTGRMERQSPVLYWLAFPGSVTTQPTSRSFQVSASSDLTKASSFPYSVQRDAGAHHCRLISVSWYARLKALTSQPLRPVKRDVMAEYLKFFDEKCAKSKVMTDEAKQYIPGGVQHNLAFN